jgi:hypothetical protein
VLESPDHGPQLCYVVAESLPPQCEGPDIGGWDWSKVEAESRSGTTWGEYVVTGTFDGHTFTLTEPARVDDGTTGQSGFDGLGTPCPEPPGGWKPVDPARATNKAFPQASERAQAADGFGQLWIDQQIPAEELTEWNSNDPKRFVLNITTTGDVAAMDSAVREVWGGSLCVSKTPRSQAELAEIRRTLPELPHLISLTTDGRAGQVEVGLVVATEELQQRLDERYGEGAVRLWGLLEPIDL